MLALIDEVSAGEVRGDAARMRIWECRDIYTMSAEESTKVIQTIDKIMSQKSEAAALLHTSLLERGDLMTLLEDAQTLSPGSRKAKWDKGASARQEEKALQIARAVQTMELSLMRTENRRANRAAWDKIDASDVAVQRFDLLAASEEGLLLKSPLFWKSVSLEDMPEDLMRACMGRIDTLLSAHGRGRFPDSLGRRYDEQLARLPMPTAADAREDPPAPGGIETAAVGIDTDPEGDSAPRAVCGCLSLVRRIIKRK